MLGDPNPANVGVCDVRAMRTETKSRAPRATGDPIVGAIIRKKRETLGLSQDDLAEAVDRSRSHVANIEAGRDSAGAKMLAGMAKRLGLSLDVLMQSAPEGTPGTYTITVTEEEANLIIAARGVSPDERDTLTRMMLRGSREPKQS
jgi:transcriptional regulator with XRE-family HTH domain